MPGLQHVADGYTKDELKALIMRGQREIAPLDSHRPSPPLYMPPWRGMIQEGDLEDLAAYVLSLKTKSDVDF